MYGRRGGRRGLHGLAVLGMAILFVTPGLASARAPPGPAAASPPPLVRFQPSFLPSGGAELRSLAWGGCYGGNAYTTGSCSGGFWHRPAAHGGYGYYGWSFNLVTGVLSYLYTLQAACTPSPYCSANPIYDSERADLGVRALSFACAAPACTNGTYAARATWALAFAANLTPCAGTVSLTLLENATVTDAATGASVGGGSVPVWAGASSGPLNHTQHRVAVPLNFSVTLTTGHTYIVTTYIDLEARALAGGTPYGSCTSTAALNWTWGGAVSKLADIEVL